MKKMTKEQLQFVHIVDKYHHGTEQEREQAKAEAIQILDRFVREIYYQRFGSFKDFKEDLLQEGYLAIIEKIGSYNPTKTAPVTYFYPHIFHNMNYYLHKDKGISEYYRVCAESLEAAAIRLAQENKSPTITNLSIETGFKEGKILQVQSVMQVVNVLHIQDESFLERSYSNMECSPEELAIKQIEKEAIVNALSNLSEIEERVITKHFYEGKKFQTIANEEKKSIHQIRTAFNAAIRKLKNNPEVIDICGERAKRSSFTQKEDKAIPYSSNSEKAERLNAIIKGITETDEIDIF